MTESRDPLGKRALFWAPAERVDDDEPVGGAKAKGKRGLFSPAIDYDGPERRSRQGKYALFSNANGYEGPERRIVAEHIRAALASESPGNGRSVVDLEPVLETIFSGQFETSRRIKQRLCSIKHLPDGYVWRFGKERPVAIELELTAKSVRRVAKIIDLYRADLSIGGVLYVVGDETIARLIKRHTLDDRLFSVILRSELMSRGTDANRSQST